MLYVAPIRIGLGVLWLVAARLAGAAGPSAVLAFGGSTFVVVFLSFNDPRHAFLHGGEPEPAPLDATYARPLEQALAATLPSTVGVGVLALAAVAWQPILTALLGGISAGLGVAGVLRALTVDPALWFDRRKKLLYRR